MLGVTLSWLVILWYCREDTRIHPGGTTHHPDTGTLDHGHNTTTFLFSRNIRAVRSNTPISALSSRNRRGRGRRSWRPGDISRTPEEWSPRWWGAGWCWHSSEGTKWCWCARLLIRNKILISWTENIHHWLRRLWPRKWIHHYRGAACCWLRRTFFLWGYRTPRWRGPPATPGWGTRTPPCPGRSGSRCRRGSR